MTKVLSGQIHHKLLQVSTTGDLGFSPKLHRSVQGYRQPDERDSGGVTRDFTVKSAKKEKKQKKTEMQKRKRTNPT